jgi:hypothetical protein
LHWWQAQFSPAKFNQLLLREPVFGTVLYPPHNLNVVISIGPARVYSIQRRPKGVLRLQYIVLLLAEIRELLLDTLDGKMKLLVFRLGSFIRASPQYTSKTNDRS